MKELLKRLQELNKELTVIAEALESYYGEEGATANAN